MNFIKSTDSKKGRIPCSEIKQRNVRAACLESAYSVQGASMYNALGIYRVYTEYNMLP